nr:serine/threonine kinase [Pandoravirus massiliensis]
MQVPIAPSGLRGVSDARRHVRPYRQTVGHSPAAKGITTAPPSLTASLSSSSDSLSSSPSGSPLMEAACVRSAHGAYTQPMLQARRGHGDRVDGACRDRGGGGGSSSSTSPDEGTRGRGAPSIIAAQRCGPPRAGAGRHAHDARDHQARSGRSHGTASTTTTTAPIVDRRPRPSVTVPMLPLCETDEDAQAVRALSGDKRYAVVRRLGSGASSTVFLACDRLRSDALVAIKVVSDAKVSRSEILAGMLLSAHPNMATMIDWFAARDHYFLVFEHVDGPDLQVLWAADAPDTRVFFAEDAFRRVFLCVLDAIAHCHARGVVHRDIKMENVVLRDEGASACLVDFGFAFFVRPPRALLADGIASTVPATCLPDGGTVDGNDDDDGGDEDDAVDMLSSQQGRHQNSDGYAHASSHARCHKGDAGAGYDHEHSDGSDCGGSDGENDTKHHHHRHHHDHNNNNNSKQQRDRRREALAHPHKRARPGCAEPPPPTRVQCQRVQQQQQRCDPHRTPRLDCIYRRNREGMLVAVRMDTPDALNASNAFVGTEEYCAPELTLGALIDPEDLFATDIYSLGVLLHVGLTNRFPQRPSFVRFLVETRQRLERVWHGVDPRVALADPRLIAEINRRGALDLATVPLSIEVCDLIARMLRPVPAERITLAEIHAHPWVVAGRRRHHHRP